MTFDPLNDKRTSVDPQNKIVVHIRQDVRSNVYRSALHSSRAYGCGFLLGSLESAESPAIEFSLVSATPATVDEFVLESSQLSPKIDAARQTAAFARMDVVGLFIAQDTGFAEGHRLITALFAETAAQMRLPYLIVFPTIAFEASWAPQCYAVNGLPNGPLSYRNTRGKLSIEPHHNPRRVRAVWRQVGSPGLMG